MPVHRIAAIDSNEVELELAPTLPTATEPEMSLDKGVGGVSLEHSYCN